MESGARAKRVCSTVPSLPLPHRHCHNTAKRVALPCRIPKALPPYNSTGVPRQRNMAQMKEQIKTPAKELSNEEIDNLSDAEFKTLVIRLITEMIEFGCKMKEEMKTIQSEIKENRDSNQQFEKEGRNKHSTTTE